MQKENIFLKKENNNYHSQIYSLEVQIDKLNSDINNQREKLINDDYKKMYSELLTENSNLKKLQLHSKQMQKNLYGADGYFVG